MSVERRFITVSVIANDMTLFLYLFLFLFFTSIRQCRAKDTMLFDSLLSDEREDSLVSSGERFQLGFFTPNGSIDITRRYLGIWYYNSNPRAIVWIANRDSPVSGPNTVLTISNDGNLKLSDAKGNKVFWSTNLEKTSSSSSFSSSLSRTVKLFDDGNLVFTEEDQEDQSIKILWQSFNNPTDTFLPGMRMDENLILTSWKSYNDPSQGNFTFQLDQDGGNNQFSIWKRSVRYWKSGVSGKFITTDEMPSSMLYLLLNFTSSIVHNDSIPYLISSMYNDTRLVMSSLGQAQYLKRDSEKVWSLVWIEPRDRCSVYNVCGNFASCNSKGDVLCKCLPGFSPSSPESWNAGDYSGGCVRKSLICNKDSGGDTFLSLKMMKAGNPDSQFNAKSDIECKIECLNNCQCQAYSYVEAEIIERSGTGNPSCWIWSEDLNNLQEEYDSGRDLYIRVALSDLELTKRNCETCGTNLIPYPLSTGPECGDPVYFNFNCSVANGQVSFEVPGGSFRVKSINPEERKFLVQTNDAGNCGDRNWTNRTLRLNESSPYHVINWCNADDEVEIGWDPPSEPTCSSQLDCHDWPDSTCNVTVYGKKKCLCETDFHWDGLAMNCSAHDSYRKKTDRREKAALSLIIAVTFVVLFILMIVAGTMFYTYFWRSRQMKRQQSWGNSQKDAALQLYENERRVKDLLESGRFKEEDTKGIDIPCFDVESILTATSNFSNANKLGQGGFGPVYKGKFPGGQEVAVKRLSSGSGQGFEEFKNEVLLIAKLQHRNLVRLLGYCVEGDEKMLLYEYMPNKSLDSFIFDRKLCVLLDWEMRFKIISGIARGLLYLHQDSRLRIIHRDLKTSNILLDEEMNPKISDFGLARIFGGKETVTNTKRVVGTYGYMSPEYALDGLFSVKSDVFSFGVVIIEMISGKRNTGFYHSEQALSLLGYAWHMWIEDKAMDLMDPTLCRKNCNTNEYMKCVNLGLLCVQEDPCDRPTMSNVIFMLGSETATLPSPKQPAFVVRRCPSSRASSSGKPETFSNNELTVTLEDGR